MSNQTAANCPSVRIIRYKLPIPLKITCGVTATVCILVTLSAIFQTRQYDAAAGFFAIGAGLTSFIYGNNSGYRIAWDDEHVFMREWGFRNILFQRQPYHAIRFEDIGSIEGRFRTNPAAMSQFMPYEYLEIASKNPDERDIWVYPLSLDSQDLEEFLSVLFRKRPELFPPALAKALRKQGFLEQVSPQST